MKKTVIIILSLSICLVSGKSQKQIEKLMKSLQDQYQIYTIEDLHKLKSKLSVANRTSTNRDMSDIVGGWSIDHTNIGMYVTVGTDQSITNSVALMGLDSAEGGIVADHINYDTELNYMIDASIFEEDEEEDYDYDPNGDNDNDYDRNADALTYAQDYVDDNSSQYNQSTFDLVTEFTLTVDGDNVTGGLGGSNPGNCEINWPEDPFKMAVYSFVSEYVLEEGGSVGCFVDDENLDQSYGEFALEMESGWTGNDDDDDDDDDYSYGPRIAAYLTDLDPSLGGQVYFDDTDTEATITFLDVPLIENSSALNTFQMQLIYETDEVVMSYKDLSLSGQNTFDAPGGLAIGIANGEGNYDDVDLSESSGQSYLNPVQGFSNSNELDMEYKKITFTPDAEFLEYSIMVETITDLPGTYSNEITVDDDDYTSQLLSSDFMFYGESWDQIFINNDGNIGFEYGDETCVCWICDNGDGDCAAQYLAGGDDNGDGEDDGPDFMIMNFDFFNFFAFMFGVPLEGVEHPLLVSIDLEEEKVLAQGLTPFGQEPDIYFANPTDFDSYITIDTIESTITFSGLDLIDTTGAVMLKLDGTIGPGMIDLMADEVTEIPFPLIMMDEGNEPEIHMIFYEDSTGITVEMFEDYYYNEEIVDTSDFEWYATSDSIYLIQEDNYENIERVAVAYEFNGDTLIVIAEEHPCDEYIDYYNSTMEECMEGISEELTMLAELDDVVDFFVLEESIMIPISMVSIPPDVGTMPQQFSLYPAYPNPFNPITTIRFDVGDATVNITSLQIYDITGRNVATLINEQIDPGNYELQWNASDHPSGVYFSELISGSTRLTRKMVLLK